MALDLRLLAVGTGQFSVAYVLLHYSPGEIVILFLFKINFSSVRPFQNQKNGSEFYVQRFKAIKVKYFILFDITEIE